MIASYGLTPALAQLAVATLSIPTAKHVAILEIAGHALWAPDRNVVLVGLFNRDVQLFWRSPEYGIDLAIFDAETRVLQRLASSTAEYEFVPVKWDGPERVLFRQRYFHNGREEEALVYYVGEVTENPLVPTLTAEVASSNLLEILSRKLQLAGLRAHHVETGSVSCSFLTATDWWLRSGSSALAWCAFWWFQATASSSLVSDENYLVSMSSRA